MINETIRKKFMELLAAVVEECGAVNLQIKVFDNKDLEPYGGPGYASVVLGEYGHGFHVEMMGETPKAAAAKLLGLFSAADAASGVAA